MVCMSTYRLLYLLFKLIIITSQIYILPTYKLCACVCLFYLFCIILQSIINQEQQFKFKLKNVAWATDISLILSLKYLTLVL